MPVKAPSRNKVDVLLCVTLMNKSILHNIVGAVLCIQGISEYELGKKTRD
jgi:hypothetical protein